MMNRLVVAADYIMLLLERSVTFYLRVVYWIQV